MPTVAYGDPFEQVPAGLYRTTPDGEIQDANREFVEMLRYPDRQSLLRTSANELYVDPEDRARWQRVLLQRGIVRHMETRLRRADGSTLWVRESARAERDASGRVLYYEGLIEDISREVEARASARRGYQLYRALVEHSSDLILELDRDKRVLYASPSVRRLLGYEAAELRGRDALDFVPAEEHAEIVAAFERAASHPERGAEVAEHRLRAADDSWLSFESRGTAVHDAQGSLRFVVTARDVSQRRAAEAALRASEQKFRDLAEQSPNMVFINQRGRVVYANPCCERELGYSREELCSPGFDFRNLVAPESLEQVTENLQRHLRGQDAPAYEATLLAKDGRRLVAIHSTRLIDYDGSPAILGLVTDITERKQAEEAIRHSESRFRSIFEFAPLGIYLSKPDGSIVAANKRLVEILGYASSEELLLGSLADIYRGPDDRRESLDSHAPIGEVVDLEARWRRKDGTPVWVQLSSHNVTDASGQVVGSEGFVRDITHRKLLEQARQQLEEDHARLTLAVENAAESILITDPGGTIVYVNPAFERITGYSRKEVLGRNPRLLKSGRQDASLYDQLWSTLLKGEVWSGRFVNKRKDGGLFEEEATISPVRDAAGRVVNYVAVKHDVTNERRLEQQLRQAQKMEAVGRLAGGVAHDFNNLLGVIIGYGELLRNRLPSGDASRSRLEQILKAAERAGGLTRQLLAFSRRQVLQPKILDLNLVVQEMERLLKRLIGEDVDLVTSLHQDLWRVRADPGQVEQVIMNLAVNARDAMPEGGRLAIATRNVELAGAGAGEEAVMPPGRYALLEIADTGLGIGPEALPHIFEPFFTTKELGKGTGLGLSTVYGIVKQSGGYVWASSELRRGATFKVYLPGYDVPLEAGGEAPSPPMSRGRETLLLVEDEPMLLALLQETLQAEGYTVLTAVNGDAAVETARIHAGEVHLMLSDVVMPGISGRALAQQMAALRPEMRILFVSGYTDEAIARQGVLEPGVEFLGKPFTPQVVALRVRAILDAAKAAASLR